MTTVMHWCQWLQNTGFSTSIRESGYTYPFIEAGHVLGLSLSVGTVIWFDLRLTGLAMRHEPASRVFNQVRPWMLAGFAIMFVTGGLLFSARALEAFNSNYFRIKIGLLALAGLNVVLFHSTIDRSRDRWDTVLPPPMQVRAAGWLSLVIWFAVIAAGRIMAYNL